MFNRSPAPTGGGRQTSETAIFPAPVRGWIKNRALATAKAGEAEILENFFPTAEGARMRGGSVKLATIGDAVTYLAPYEVGGTGSALFATDSANIYDVTSPADADTAVTAAVSSMTSGDWSSVQFENSAGVFLIMVNGFDDPRIYDGSAWGTPGDGTYTAISGVTASSLSHVWKFKARLFFIETGTMNAWYLDTDAIGGTASKIPLGSVFQSGGELMFGATWSSDTGAGPDDFCLFVTDQGEVAVYQGTDPSTADTWAIVGVFRIGKPLHKNAWFKAGGDIAIVTDDGIIPLSAAIHLDRAALQTSAVTYPIEDAWRDTIRQRKGTAFPFSVVLWQSETMLVVGVPTFSGLDKFCLVANSKTGAWAKYTGWDTRCVTVFKDKLYFGTAAGTVIEGETEGADDDVSYSATFLPRFDTFNRPQEKAALAARIVARSNLTFTPQLFACADYDSTTPNPSNADSDVDSSLWGTGVWGTAKWGTISDAKARVSEWQSVSASGQALAPGLILTSGRISKPDIDLVALHLQYEMGGVL